MGFDLSTGEDVRSVSLRSGLRGYDKSDVDQFRSAVADLVDDLRRRVDAASGHLAQLGLDDPLDLQEEFASVGKEVTAILEAARSAATDIRKRAADDGERWREEASADATRMRTEAWDEASGHLESAVAEAAQTRASADEDALFIRAQAEKEAIRLTSEAKRDADDLVRAARSEAEAIIAESRDAAHAAQERTRALEVRREELMVELEEARRAIGHVEAQIDEQHQRLTTPETTTVRIIDQGGGEPSPVEEGEGWLDGDTSVRLVPGRSQPSSDEFEPVVDADDMVAEVERLQIEPDVDDPWTIAQIATGAADAASAVVDDEPSPVTDAADEIVQTEATGAEIVDGVFEEETEEVAEGEPSVVDDARSDAAASPDVDAPEPGGTATDGLTDLFASLREPPPSPREAPGVTGQVDDTSVPGAAETPGDVTDADDGGVEGVVADATESEADDDGFAAREAVLLPLTNRTLRAVKKQILEFQNVMLEATKADPAGWRPEADEYRLALDPHVQALVDEVHGAAGGAGAAETKVEFGAALATAVTDAALTMQDSGYRETSASLGRIYRSWRSDEAERRLTALSAAVFEAATASRTSSRQAPIDSGS